MPKAKKRKVSPKTENVSLSNKKKWRSRPKSKQKAASGHEAVDPLIAGKASATAQHTPASSVPQSKKRHERPPEIQALRGNLDPTATVTADNFELMDFSLQANLRGVFQDLNNAFGKTSAPTDAKPLQAQQIHGRATRAAAEHSAHFFKTLIPNANVPEEVSNINVEFEGTNTIKTNAPGYTETINFGNGTWTRTRNGVTEKGVLDDQESERIMEQTKLMSEGILKHTAKSLAGFLEPDDMSPFTSPTLGRGVLPMGTEACIQPIVNDKVSKKSKSNKGGLLGADQEAKISELKTENAEMVADAEESIVVDTSTIDAIKGTKDNPRKRARVKASDIF